MAQDVAVSILNSIKILSADLRHDAANTCITAIWGGERAEEFEQKGTAMVGLTRQL